MASKADMQEDLGSGKEPQVYELGYHIISTVSEDALEAEVAKVTGIIKAVGGAFIADGFPKKIDLAYEISKKMGGERHDFTTAYFGWTAFELPAEKINEVKAAIELLPAVLRLLVIKTTKEDIEASTQPAKSETAGERLVTDESNAGEVSDKALADALEGIAA